MNKIIIETNRLILRELNKNSEEDYNSLCEILKDKETMYAYEHGFTEEECREWFERQINRYKTYGFGLWAVILKENNKLIGQAGLTMQNIDIKINGSNELLEIGYLFNKNYWHLGYAIESAISSKEYAFNKLNADRVYSIIRDNNIASQKVAIKNQMKIVTQITKHYYNIDMPHYVFCCKK
ncbi:GNAT family N-acetyltransferase [Brachyspira sp. SAP_772]|uniref:GNAT family N-acetyltransferase n=1 Tax=Brachyspira sp. SAP_772 TaxID=2608385 RepID=UPI0012F4E777|nr:GNAT family N-acetyltransferase [Brachyspira sp. SAP_772]